MCTCMSNWWIFMTFAYLWWSVCHLRQTQDLLNDALKLQSQTNAFLGGLGQNPIGCLKKMNTHVTYVGQLSCILSNKELKWPRTSLLLSNGAAAKTKKNLAASPFSPSLNLQVLWSILQWEPVKCSSTGARDTRGQKCSYEGIKKAI